MKRRTFALRGAASIAGSVLLAGCTEETLTAAESQPPPVEERYDERYVDLPVSESVEVAEAEIERTAEAEVDDVEAFEALLADRGLAVESIEEVEEEGEPVLSLEYGDDQSEERGVLYGLGVVAGGYVHLVGAGHGAEKLDALLLDPDGRPFGHYEVDAELAEAYDGGEITAAEYARRVIEELETGDR